MWARSAFGAALLLAGCAPHPYRQELNETRSIEAAGAESVRAVVDMGAGQLSIRGGAGKLLDAEFEYNVPGWKPEVKYDVSHARGYLRVCQPSGLKGVGFGRRRNDWELRFNDRVPLDLRVHMGAGLGKLELRGLRLEGLEVNLGAGRLELDLDAPWQQDVRARIRGGVGSAEIRLPREVGVRVHASGGLGSIDARGLRRSGGDYVNEAYGRSPVTVRVDVSAGIGHLELIG